MSSIWGEKVKFSIFGESHGSGIGVILDGLPAGEKIDMDEIMFQMSRRAPGKDKTSTQRKELDIPEILSGWYNGFTTGSPMCAIIRNNDMHSDDYADLNSIPRPGHADYTGFVKYNGFNDYRGGGHFSGRLTAPMVFAGAVCRQILSRKGIETAAHIASIANIQDNAFDPVNVSAVLLNRLVVKRFPVLNEKAEAEMRNCIEQARLELDSVGGIVECAAVGLPAGLGDPIFDGVENKLASILFGIPAVKGVEFGNGFGSALLRGSQNNDAFVFENGKIKTATNRHGGILGGITSSMPLLFRVAFKPTPSILKKQQSVDIRQKKNTVLEIQGRHDPCIVVRAVPVVEAVTAVCLLDILMNNKHL
jgi:chorismate synthase